MTTAEEKNLVDLEHRVTAEEATRLMIHHLRIASAYFEATADDRGRRANEIAREELWYPGAAEAASSFIDVLCSHYEDLDK